MSLQISAAVLTVSDTCSQTPSLDKSGPTIQQILADAGIAVAETRYKVVPDDLDAIRSVVRGWVNGGGDGGSVDWIITTGGTGFGVRDVTPEAISPLLERQAPGLVHLLLASSLKHTPLAALSRPVAGTAKNTLITTLPGSVKAVKECLEALLGSGVVGHAVDLVRGGDGRSVHASLAAGERGPEEEKHSGGGHRGHHQHHHGSGHRAPQPRSEGVLSHDPNAPASARHRHSPYPIVSLEEALSFINSEIATLPVETRVVDHTLRGYVLAEDVRAPHNVPSTPTTNVDGYALRSTDPPGTYNVLTSKTFNTASGETVPQGSIYRINTGGPLPAGTDAVIMVEDTKLVSTYSAEEATGPKGEEKQVETLAQVPKGENVRAAGSDVLQGDLVMRTGERVLSVGGEVGTLAFVGRKEVKVYRKPKVALLSTGNELVDLQSPARNQGGEGQGAENWGGIYDTNRPALQAVLEGLGYEALDLGIVVDQVDAHVQALQKGVTETDIILTTGGTSMGPTDLLKPVIERNFGGTVHFGRVGIKPGKPTTFATIPVPGSTTARRPVFALPGNPASALVTFYVFVLPALRRLGGWPAQVRNLPRVRVKIKSRMPFDPRVEFHRVVVKVQPSTGVLEAWSTGGQRSSRVASLSGANGFVIVPSSSGAVGGKSNYDPGDLAEAILVGELQVA